MQIFEDVYLGLMERKDYLCGYILLTKRINCLYIYTFCKEN